LHITTKTISAKVSHECGQFLIEPKAAGALRFAPIVY
jgi:hypothetical protein